MTRSPGLLLEAVDRELTDGEDRLTEILAVVLQTVPEFVRTVCHRAGLEDASRHEVSTQLRVDGKRVDLEVLAIRANGQVGGRLWIESKTWSDFALEQLANYRYRLHARPGLGRLVALVPTQARATVPHDADDTITWQNIAEIADEVGLRLDRQAWTQPFTPKTPTQLTLLRELVACLERRTLAFMDNLSNTDVVVAKQADDTKEVLRNLMSRASDEIGLKPSGKLGRHRSFASFWQAFEPGDNNWATSRGGYPELALFLEDEWKSEDVALREPCFGAGYTFPPGSGFESLGTDDATLWKDAQRGDEQIWRGWTGDYGRCMRCLYLSELVVRGVTFGEQAAYLGRWALGSIQAVGSAEPPAR